MKKNKILTVNVGSSSLKLGLYEALNTGDLKHLCRLCVDLSKTPPGFQAEGEGAVCKKIRIHGLRLSPQEDSALSIAAQVVLAFLENLESSSLGAVGHRIVHGGTFFQEPTLLTEDVLSRLKELMPLAPLHEPASLDLVKTLKAALPGIPHVACFDTTFHRSQPRVAFQFALPREMEKQGIRRYGFHGLSCESVMRALRVQKPGLLDKKIIVAHLGSGASLSAIFQGKSMDTTMGFSALDGLPMASRCGSLDVGVVLYLLDEKKMSFEALQDLLYHQSGLLGVSGISGDVRTLLDSDAPEAREALDLFVYRIAREVGALTASLKGIDGIIFTAGIGEHASWVRQKVCARLAWLGVDLDVDLNERGQYGALHTKKSSVEVWVIPSDEETIIATHTFQKIFSQPLSKGEIL